MHTFILDDSTKNPHRKTNQHTTVFSFCMLFLACQIGFATPITDIKKHSAESITFVEVKNVPLGSSDTNAPFADPCSQKTEGDNPISGGSLWNGPTNQLLAFDIPIHQGTTFEVKSIKVNTIDVATSFNVIIRENTSTGVPSSTALYTYNNATISGSSLIGTVGNYNRYEYTLDVSSQNWVLNSNSGITTYWMQIVSNAFAWETTQTTQIGANAAFSNSNNSGAWVINLTESDLVYELIGECSGCLPPTTLLFSQISHTEGTLNWPTSSGTTFDLEWDVTGFTPGNNSAANQHHGLNNQYSLTLNNLIYEQDYHAYIRQDCGSDGLSNWAGPFNFKTGDYCPNYAFYMDYYINSFVTTGGIPFNIENINSGFSLPVGQGNFTDMIVSSYEGGQINFTMEAVTTPPGFGFNIWVDWNNNAIFELNELMYNGVGETLSGSFTVPIGQALGDYRMRIKGQYGTEGPPPCGLAQLTDTEDYTFRVIPEPTCLPPIQPKATNSAANIVLLEWTSTGTSFEIEYGINGFSQGTSGGTIVSVTTNSHTLSLSDGLTTGTKYEYYVRRHCGSNDDSLWMGPVSFTPGAYTETVSTRINLNPQVGDDGCGITFNVDVPSGMQLASLNVKYKMLSGSPFLVSHQRSVLYSPTLNMGESAVISGQIGNDSPGLWDYNRDVTFANEETGTIVFELKAWRPGGSIGCADTEMRIEGGSWILTPTFETLSPCPKKPANLGYTIISDTDVELTWTAGISGAQHQIKWGTIGFDQNTTGTSESVPTNVNSYTLSGLDSSIPYEFYIRRDCGSENYGNWVGPFRFNSSYCIPWSSLGYNFTAFNTTNADTNITYSETVLTGSGYVNKTDLIIEHKHGEQFDFTSNYIGASSGLRIWVDWNKNFIFEDTEVVFYQGSNSGNKSGTITVPLNTVTGDYRMRVRAENGATSIPPPCGEIVMGGTIDFTLRVDGVVASITDFDVYNFSYFPNPVNDMLYLNSNTPIDNVVVSNMLGQQVSVFSNSDNTNLDLSNLPTGNYLVKVKIEGVSKVIKVVKK